MAISVGTVSTGDTGASAASTCTISHTVDAGTSILIVGVGGRYSSARNVNGVTYDGDALTKLVEYDNAVNETHAALFYMVNPTPGTANVVITWSGVTYGAGVCVDLSGVDTDDPFGETSYQVSSGNEYESSTGNITTETGDFCIDVVAKKCSDEAITAGQTELGQDQCSNATATNNIIVGMSYKLATGATTALTWSWSGVTRQYVDIGYVVHPAPVVPSSFFAFF